MDLVTVHLDKDYRLGYGTKALRTFERDLGPGRTSEVLTDQTSVGIDVIVCLLHAGMVYEHPEVTLDDLDTIIDGMIASGRSLEKVIETVVTEAVTSGWGPSPTEAVSETDASGTATTSGSPEASPTASPPSMYGG